MFKSLAVASTLALLTSQTFGQDTPGTVCTDSVCCEDQFNNCPYKEFYTTAAIYGYDWDAHFTSTSDGFILTLLHITGKGGQPMTQRTQPPVIIQHAMGSDASYMIAQPGLTPYNAIPGMPTVQLPIPLQLYEKGFDVWFTNARGNTYSKTNLNFEDDSEQYWDFSFDTLGKYDNVANMKYIYDVTGGQKVSFFGYSLGTTQGFYSLATLEDEFFAEHAQAFAFMGPCTVASFIVWPLWNRTFMTIFKSLGIYAQGGPYWYEELPRLCQAFGAEACFTLQKLGFLKNISYKTLQHQAQNHQQGRFQEYSDNYWDLFKSDRTTQLIDLRNIKKVPVGMYVGGNDITCLPEEAEKTRDLIGDMVKDFVIYPGVAHEDFATKTDKEFADRIAAMLGTTSNATDILI